MDSGLLAVNVNSHHVRIIAEKPTDMAVCRRVEDAGIVIQIQIIFVRRT